MGKLLVDPLQQGPSNTSRVLAEKLFGATVLVRPPIHHSTRMHGQDVGTATLP